MEGEEVGPEEDVGSLKSNIKGDVRLRASPGF